jgi:hypothetical protein
MSQLSDQSRVELEADAASGMTFAEWAESRATLLVAIGMLVLLLMVLIVISVLHPR